MKELFHISRKSMMRTVVFIAAVAIIFIALPKNTGTKYVYGEGRLWNYDAIVTPVEIPIFNDPEQQKAIEDSLKSNFKPIYYRDNAIADKVINEYRDQLISGTKAKVTAAQSHQIVSALNEIYKVGVFDSKGGQIPTSVRIYENGKTVSDSTPSASFYSFASAHTRLHEALENDTALNNIVSRFSPNILPNIVYDSLQNKRALDIYQKSAQAVIETVYPGTKIVERGDVVTAHTYKVLQSYEKEMAKQSQNSDWSEVFSGIGAVMIIMVMLGLLFAYLRFFRPDYFANIRVVLMMSVFVTAFVLFAFALSGSFDRGIYMVPYAIIPIVLLVFLDSRTAFFTYVVTLLLCAAMTHFMWDFILLQFAAGFVALISIRELSKRSQLLMAALFIFVAYSIVYLCSELMQTGSFGSIQSGMFGAFAINATLISFAYVIIFLVEKTFGFISRVTLVELSDINHPILRELSEECPGTFQHSMAVSNIAAAAASRLGANVQLVRAGALYHDIGKISNPAFFTENQHGINPHDALSPIQSSRVVIGHVTEGIKRAERAKLPARIRDFILQHHGRGTARYFYTTYCNQHPDEEIDPAPFTYPGPNPQTMEASILMMADAVEAASRSLKDHSPESIESSIDKIIDTQVREGLHNDSPISFRDISTIKKSFASSLSTMYHSRISYPDAVKPSSAEPSAPKDEPTN